MRGKIPVVACVVAAMLGVSGAALPEVRTQAAAASVPTMKDDLAELLADRKWERPAPGSYTPAPHSTDGLPPVISRIATEEKVVFLTIDDGYEYDAEFVELVRREKVPILTFLTTTYTKGYGQYFWAMRHAGSQMENHTVSHPNLATLPAAAQKQQICGASDTITAQYGRRPQILRPPFGSLNLTTRQVAKECGIKSILLWSAEYYNGTTSPQGVRDAFARGDGGQGFKPGDIVLMHYRKGLAQQLRTILGWIERQGYRAAAVENYLPRSLGGNAPDRPAGKAQGS